MAAEKIVVGGVVRGGVVVPEHRLALPEGAQVEIVFPFNRLSPELQAEFDAWDRAGKDSWAMIDQWEKEERA